MYTGIPLSQYQAVCVCFFPSNETYTIFSPNNPFGKLSKPSTLQEVIYDKVVTFLTAI